MSGKEKVMTIQQPVGQKLTEKRAFVLQKNQTFPDSSFLPLV